MQAVQVCVFLNDMEVRIDFVYRDGVGERERSHTLSVIRESLQGEVHEVVLAVSGDKDGRWCFDIILVRL